MAEVVVVGLGYVGLPLALTMASAGHRVTGLEIDHERVDAIMTGAAPVDGLLAADLRETVGASFTATTDPQVIADADVVLICVPTGLDREGSPDLGPLRAAARTIGDHVTADTLVVLVSTSWPGTTLDLVLPEVDRGRFTVGEDLWVAVSPERGSPGEAALAVARTPRVVGGVTESSTFRAATFLKSFCDDVVTATGTREAELSKLVENTFRLVNIALVTELLPVCHDLGIDLWDAIDCAETKPFGFMAFRPGPGAGGHCIPVDPVYLTEHVRAALGRPLELSEAALRTNRGASTLVARRVLEILAATGRPVEGARVLLAGVSYKPDIGDTRGTPAGPVAQLLIEAGAAVVYHDPWVREWDPRDADRPLERREDLYAAAAEADVTVLLQVHHEYDLDLLESAAVALLDTRGVMRGRSGIHVL